MIRIVGLDEAQAERARRITLGIVGRDVERLTITITRGTGRKLSVTIDDPTPRQRASLLPEMETTQAFDDLATVLAIAVQEALE